MKSQWRKLWYTLCCKSYCIISYDDTTIEESWLFTQWFWLENVNKDESSTSAMHWLASSYPRFYNVVRLVPLITWHEAPVFKVRSWSGDEASVGLSSKYKSIPFSSLVNQGFTNLWSKKDGMLSGLYAV